MAYPAVLAALVGFVVARSPYDLPESEWASLNATVGGRLGRGVPLARDCYAQAGVNVTGPAAGLNCATVQSKYATDSEWAFWAIVTGVNKSDRKPGELVFTGLGWSYNGKRAKRRTRAVYSTPTTPAMRLRFQHHECATKVAYLRTIQDRSRRNSGIRLLKKDGRAAFNQEHRPTFVPEGCKQDGAPALTYGAGQDLESLFLFADKNNLTFIGGSTRTVGAAGGWVQGGGHGILTNTYGLGSDRVLQFKVVTPDGRSRVANACQNQDLFWALRGGGGGTFGVVLEATSQVVPNPVGTVIFVENSVRWSQEGWGGFLYPTTSLLANPRLNRTAAEASLKPLTDFLRGVPDGAGGSAGSGAQVQWSQYDSFLPLLSAIVTGSATTKPRNFAMSSRLIPQTAFSNATSLLAAMLQSYQTAGGSVAKNERHPSWRGAVWHAIASSSWGYDAGPDVAKQAYVRVNSAMNPLRAITPNSGAYHNEADVYEPNTSQSFWGSNYPALYAIKQKYDPDKLLDCWHCVDGRAKAHPLHHVISREPVLA
ncbi:oxygen-dependent FAD-linked oxidoreductase family [Rhizoctonia solani]|uniref:Oxygen-dependent FAD-linked oxidoreductase family n=1 Tax=Rhizoctonia solani TaxID=456999 RepID=A0A8H7I314_9AGAM|nr:oxygen-dependent FAD-linked oxidoreductase family [Rhizoctonia solani]